MAPGDIHTLPRNDPDCYLVLARVVMPGITQRLVLVMRHRNPVLWWVLLSLTGELIASWRDAPTPVQVARAEKAWFFQTASR